VQSSRRVVVNENQVDQIAGSARATPVFVTNRTDSDHLITVFNNQLCLASLAEEDADFYRAFSQTVMFHRFIDDKMDGVWDPIISPSILARCDEDRAGSREIRPRLLGSGLNSIRASSWMRNAQT
jgi:hypothetical protein